MKMTEEEICKFVLRVHINRAHRLYFEKGKSPEEIAETLRRPVRQIEKWIEKFKIYHAKKNGENG